MIRLGALGVGLFFILAVLWGAVQPREASPPDPVKALHKHPHEIEWVHNGAGNLGITGTFDRKQLQRGFQVYKEVCSACHSIHRVAFRDLADLGFSPAEIKAIAAEYEVPSIDDKTGDPATRKATPADKFPLLYPNEIAARAAQNGALPPDLSLITKAREDGTNYVHSLVSGYADAPASWTVPDGLYYNPYFKSLNIAMPPPLSDDQITYADGTKATKDQMAKDIAVFLTWTAEPKLEARKETGAAAVLFLLLMTGLGYLSYRKVWADVKGKKAAA
ncbi:cytochrome c1 [Novosphingobium sp. PASSN1]|uniref:cytochrome c1 n=1 Tax=Novosphingobium sp. PASSN1 TaxID=2015561 RepID=UPI000BD067F4|nr:cytochrome c1 [Novosphingobium sp. PASSN1]OYU34205.1 MAG: cytochrome c1 [Novosphingobium sp. PASSN1]